MEGITFRQLDPASDFPALVQLLNKVRIQKVTAERLLEWENNVPPDRIRRTIVAERDEGNFAGYSRLYHRPGAADGRHYFDIAVEPVWRGQGLGTALYEDAFQAAVAYKAAILDADVYDNCASCLRFAKKRGFAIDRQVSPVHAASNSCKTAVPIRLPDDRVSQ